MKKIVRYKSYSFAKFDPVIGDIRTMMATDTLTSTVVAERSGVSPTTIQSWLSGKTKRPQHATVMAAFRGSGWDMKVVKK
jgi:hypothetical protein